MFRSLFDSDQLLESEKSAERVCFDARVILFAGTDTTATSMSTAVFHLLSNPDCLAKLKKELRDAIPEADKMPTLQQVEKLPYLVRKFPLGSLPHESCQFISQILLRMP